MKVAGDVTVMRLLDGVDLEGGFGYEPITVALPDNDLINSVTIGSVITPTSALREFDDPGKLGTHIVRDFSAGSEAAFGLNQLAGNITNAPAEGKVLLYIPRLDDVGLRRGFIEIRCGEAFADVSDMNAHVAWQDLEKFVDRVQTELKPLLTFLQFGQRRPCHCGDGTISFDDRAVVRIHEPRPSFPPPTRGMGPLANVARLAPFLETCLRGWSKLDAKDRGILEVALGYHRVACATVGIIESTFLEYFAALDIASNLIAKGGQEKQLKGARDCLVSNGWDSEKLPTDSQIKEAVSVRHDLAHPRRMQVLRPGDTEQNIEVITRVTGPVVTLLEACMLWLLGFRPGADPYISVSHPFAISGRVRWYLL